MNKTLLSKDGESIYYCAHAVCGKYPKYVEPLLKAVAATNDLEKIYSFAILVPNISKDQFFELAKIIVDFKDDEGVVQTSNHVTGEGCSRFHNSFDLLEEYVEYILSKLDLDFIKRIALNLDDKIEATNKAGCSAYMPYGTAITTEMLKFKDELVRQFNMKEKAFERAYENNQKLDRDLPDITDNYYIE